MLEKEEMVAAAAAAVLVVGAAAATFNLVLNSGATFAGTLAFSVIAQLV
jgi:hypothetical protein